MNKLTDIQIEIIEIEVLRHIGYKQVPEGKIANMIREAIDLGYQLVKPLALYEWFPIEEITLKSVVLKNGAELNVGSLSKFWRGAEFLSAVLCTIGADLEQHISYCFSKGESTLALLLDSVGSAAIDSLEAKIQQHLCNEAYKSGGFIGPRLYPGSSGWPLEEQRILFNLLPADKINIFLNNHCMMIPRKSSSFCSASARLGEWKAISHEDIANPCQYCQLTSCLFRKK